MDTLPSTIQSIELQLRKPEIFVACVAVVTLLFSLYYTFSNNDEERPANFTISLPEQCQPGWQGHLLEEPAIKVNEELIAVSSGV